MEQTETAEQLEVDRSTISREIRRNQGWRGYRAQRRALAHPALVERRNRIGDGEGDTLIGARHQEVLVSLVERRSGYTLLAAHPWLPAPESDWASEPPMRYSSTPELHSRLHFQLEPAKIPLLFR
jgi:IS30 family transposase